MKEYLFTAIPLNAGVGDQTDQISILYALGRACGYKYVHTPFTCDRSTLGSLITRRLSQHVRYLRKSSTQLIEFLGLDRHELNITDKTLQEYKVLNINLYELLQQNNISTIADLKKCIETTPISKIIYSFVWTPKMYLLESKIQSLIDSTNIDRSTLQFKFAEKYWQAKKHRSVSLPFGKNKIKVVVHIRKGDTACIRLDRKIIDAWKLQYIDNINNSKYKHTEIFEYYLFLQKIFNKYGEDKFSVILVSDGYKRTFRRIKTAMLQYKLNIYDLLQLRTIEKKYYEELNIFSNHPSVSTIIGESEDKLFKSIHAIICADIIITGSFGFAWRMQKFREADNPALMIDVNNYSDRVFKSIESAIAKKV